MRITNNMMISNMMRNLNKTMGRLDKRYMQGYTGKRIHKASDDPIATSRVLKTKADISQLRQYEKNVDDSISWLENTEAAVESVNKAIKRIREITGQAANGVLTEEDTQKIQQEIKHLKSQIISIGNTTYGSSYIFSGKKIDQPLLDENGYYNMDLLDYLNPHIVDDKKDIQVGTGENIGVNTLGFEVFEGYEKPVIYAEKATNGTITIDLPDGTQRTANSIDELKEMSEEYGSPLKGYKFEEVKIRELDDSNKIVEKTYIKATPTDAIAVDNKTNPAVWDTGKILGDKTELELKPGEETTFEFMGITINIVGGRTTPPNTDVEIKDVDSKGATIVVDIDDTATPPKQSISQDDLVKAIEEALNDVSEKSNSKIDGFKFEANAGGVRVTSPKNSGGRYNKDVFTASFKQGDDQKKINVNLKLPGVGESKSVSKGQQAGIIQMIEKLEREMIEGNHEEISNLLGTIDIYHQTIMTAKAEIGAKVNRMELVSERIAGDIINFRDLQSQLEDADMAETLMELINEENVYNSALAMGARIIQPSLLDFLR